MAQDSEGPAEAATENGPALAKQLPEFSDWLPDAVQPYWSAIAQYPVIGAVAIALIFLVIAMLVRALLIRTVLRITASTSTNIDDQIVDLLSRPIFNTVFLLGLMLAAVAARMPETVTNVTVNLLMSFAVLIWMRVAIRLSGIVFGAFARLEQFQIIDERTIPLFDLIAKLSTLLIGSYLLLMVWGINPAGWLASAGIVGIAVGFAARDTLANLFSGFFILADAPYKIGDYVNLDTGERGRVTHVGMRSTRLLTRDDIEITVPNAVIANAKIINESGGPYTKMRVRIAVGAAYGSDVDQVCQVLKDVANAHPEVCRQPAARVRMRGFGDSSLDFELLAWVNEPQYRGRIAHELYMALYKAFDEAGIEIPYPKRDVYVKSVP